MGLSPWLSSPGRPRQAQVTLQGPWCSLDLLSGLDPAFSLPPETISCHPCSFLVTPASASQFTGMDWELEPSQAKGAQPGAGQGRPGFWGCGGTPLGEELGPGEEVGRGGVHGHSASAGLPPDLGAANDLKPGESIHLSSAPSEVSRAPALMPMLPPRIHAATGERASSSQVSLLGPGVRKRSFMGGLDLGPECPLSPLQALEQV